MQRGFTLVELAIVLTIVGMALASLLPAAARYRSVSAVTAARESVVGLVARTRSAAVSGGGATLTLEGGPWRARVSVGDSVVSALAVEQEFGVTLELGSGRTKATLNYNALGLGMLANETITFHRGGARRSLVVSGYGRVRRQ